MFWVGDHFLLLVASFFSVSSSQDTKEKCSISARVLHIRVGKQKTSTKSQEVTLFLQLAFSSLFFPFYISLSISLGKCWLMIMSHMRRVFSLEERWCESSCGPHRWIDQNTLAFTCFSLANSSSFLVFFFPLALDEMWLILGHVFCFPSVKFLWLESTLLSNG